MSGDISLIKTSVDVNDVLYLLGRSKVGEYTHQIKCPFHDDARPSARVYVRDGIAREIYCWTCGKSYDCIDIVMAVKECGFSDAVKWIKSKFDLPDVYNVVGEVRRKEAGRVFEARRAVERDFTKFCGPLCSLSDYERGAAEYCWDVFLDSRDDFSLQDCLDWLKWARSIVRFVMTQQKVFNSIRFVEDF